MKKRIVFVLILCVLLSLCPSALAAGQALSEEAPVFSGVYTMMLDFGSFTVLEAGFTKKVPMVYMPGTWEKGEDGNYHAAGSLNPTYTVAKDGSVAFAIKGILHNGSSDPVDTDELHPVISDNVGEPITMYGYPVVPVSEPDKTILYPGRDMKTVFACTVPTSLYYGNEDILLSFRDASLCFPKDDLESFVSMGFEKGDGVPADDVTKLLTDDSKAREEKPAANPDCFDFSNIRILSAEKWNKPGKYIMDFDFTCLYPESDDEQYPNTFELLFSFLDAESVAVKTGQLQVNNMISYGDKVRASSCPHFNASENILTPEELSEIKYVKFTGFTTWTQGAGVKNFKFQDSPVFPLTDTDGPAEKPAETGIEKVPSITTSQKQKTVIKENAYAQLAIEDFEITEVTEDRFYFKVKLRNITDNTLELSLRYQILDSNRDILTAQLIGTTTDPAAGQAIWAGPYRVDSLNENAAYISFVSSDYEGGTLQEEVLYPLQ